MIGATLAGRRERDRRHRIIRELALDQDWRIVPLVDDLRHRYPVLSLDSAVSARAELAVGGRRGATAVVLASVLVRRPPGAGGHRGPEDVVLLAQAGIPGPPEPVVVGVDQSATIQPRGPLPQGLSDALRSAAATGEFRSGEVVVWNPAGLAHLARIPHLTAAALDRHLALLDTLLAAV